MTYMPPSGPPHAGPHAPPASLRTRLVLRGEYEVTAEADVELSTRLGASVACCLCDRQAAVGGMNHFLLTGDAAGAVANERYGTYAMEVLINALLKLGARRGRLEAKLFGGARSPGRMGRIGAATCAFARGYLEADGIPLVAASLGGDRARRLRYVPATGQARVLLVQDDPSPGGMLRVSPDGRDPPF